MNIEMYILVFKKGPHFTYLDHVVMNNLKMEISIRILESNKCFFGVGKILNSTALSVNLNL